MTNTIKELEQRILNGENVTPAEFAQAHANREADQRFAELKKQRDAETTEADLNRFITLQRQADAELNPTKALSLAYEIGALEKKLTNK